MLDKMMLHAYETCIKGMERVTIAMEKRDWRSRRIKAARKNGVDIRRLLISCVQALAADDHMTAHELLKQIKQHASATGDATQRLAYYFAKGLEARILGTGSQLWQLLLLEYPSAVELLKAYILYSEACCFVNVTFNFSAMTIM
jgi:predicted HTH transcriptional regulator